VRGASFRAGQKKIRRKKVTDNGNIGQDAPKSNILGEISRPASMAALPEIVDFVASIEKQQGFSDERIAQIASAFQAALEHVVTRAYKSKSGEIKITCKHDPWGKILIAITDTGEPANILLADVVFAGEEAPGDEKMRASARLIKKTIDDIEYKTSELENVLSFFVSGKLRGKR
jgi:anti-sigma regulatory factor (Ser/Thr protein kinase)